MTRQFIPDPQRPHASPARGCYRRNLPHIQPDDRTFFVTFCTHRRWQLPEAIRSLVLDHCLREDGRRAWLHGVVVMPDHVHMVITPLRDRLGRTYGLAETMQAIKGASAHSVNAALGRKARVWQAESFDHVLRRDENTAEKVDYICANPVRRGLVRELGDYLWLWREGQNSGEGA
ncbi:MAG: transposase, partial [Candidatus Brocadiae bacterium]|nr:transposase [Candidatus Brocadiia bacterium]